MAQRLIPESIALSNYAQMERLMSPYPCQVGSTSHSLPNAEFPYLKRRKYSLIVSKYLDCLKWVHKHIRTYTVRQGRETSYCTATYAQQKNIYKYVMASRNCIFLKLCIYLHLYVFASLAAIPFFHAFLWKNYLMAKLPLGNHRISIFGKAAWHL